MNLPLAVGIVVLGSTAIALALTGSFSESPVSQRVASEQPAPAFSAGVIAFVDETGELTAPSNEALAEFARRSSQRKAIETPEQPAILEADVPELSLVMVNPPVRFSIAVVGDNGEIEIYCSPASTLNVATSSPIGGVE